MTQGRESGSEMSHRGMLLACLFAVLIVGSIWVRVRLGGSEERSVEEAIRGDADEAVAALEQVLAEQPPGKRPALLLRYADDPSPGLRYAAVDALLGLRLPEHADAIEAAMTDSSSRVRQRVVESLHQVDLKRGIRLLRRALRDEDTWIREAAAMQITTLTRLHRLDAGPIAASLVAALDLEDPVVAKTCAHTLSRMFDKPWQLKLGMSADEQRAVVAKWNDWWQSERGRLGADADLSLPDPIRPSRADPAPDFRARDFSGRVWTLRGQRGRLTLLHFWGTWCPACRGEMDDLNELHKAYSAQGLDILALTVGPRDAAAGRRFAEERRIGFAVGEAPEQVLHAYGHIHEVPVSVLIDRKGRVRYRWEGERDYRTFRLAVARFLRE